MRLLFAFHRLLLIASAFVLFAVSAASAQPPSPGGGAPPPEEVAETGNTPEADEGGGTAPAPAPVLAWDLAGIRWTPHLQFWARSETRIDAYGDGAPAPNAYFVATRARVGMEAEWRPVRVMLQFQDTRNFGTPPGADDGTTFGIHQAFAEVGGQRGFLRLGRQEINYGDQRMIGALDWLMGARSFDALRLHGELGAFTVDAAAAMRAPRAILSSGARSRGDYLASLYTTYRHSDPFLLDLYLLYRHDDPIEGNETRDRDIVSPGLRVHGAFEGGFGYTGEVTVQAGDQNGSSFLAYAASADVRYALGGASAPTFTGGFALASGAQPGGNVDEFDNFFPTNHKFYGFADLFGLRNVIEGHAGVRVTPRDMPLKALVNLHTFALQEETARWSNAGGATLGQSAAGESRSLGQELDLVARYSFLRGLFLEGGYAVFIPNDGAERLGHDEAAHFVYLWLGAQTP